MVITEGTSNGPKRSDSNFSLSAYASLQMKGITSLHMGTIAGSSKAGGKDVARTDQQTMFSDASSSMQRIIAERYTRDTSRVPRIPPMPLPAASTHPAPSSSIQSLFPARSELSSSMFDAGELARKAAVKCLVRARSPGPDCNGLAPFVRLGPLKPLKSTKYQCQTQRRQC